MKKLYAFIISLSLTLCTACGSAENSQTETTTTTAATTAATTTEALETTTTAAATTAETTTTTTTTTVTTTTPTTTTTAEPTIVEKLIIPEVPIIVNNGSKQLTFTNIETEEKGSESITLIITAEMTIGPTDQPTKCPFSYRYLDNSGVVISSGTSGPPEMKQGETAVFNMVIRNIKDDYPYTLEFYDY